MSPTTIPSSEIKVNDDMAKIDNLRPGGLIPMMSSKPTLVIQYTPSIAKSVQRVELVSTENIVSYTVTFFNADGTTIKRTVSMISSKPYDVCYH